LAQGLEGWLQGIWYGGGGGGLWLRPLSWLYALGAALHRAPYSAGLRRARRVGVPVAVIGNLTAGGTGKSPLVAALAAAVAARGVAVGILTRGHGAARTAPRHIRPDDDPRAAGDEPLMLARATGLPVVAAVDRTAGAALLRATGVQLVLSDDGLQHHALARDLEVVVIDAVRGFGNGRLLPAGPLRERPSRLGTVDWVVLHDTAPRGAGSDPAAASAGAAAATSVRGREGVLRMALLPGPARRLAAGDASVGTTRPLGAFAGQRVHAVAGIGDPPRFFAMLRAAGIAPVEHAFPDHHALSAPDLAFGDDAPVLMTSKDAVKCGASADPRLWEVPVVARLDPDDGAALVTRLVALAGAGAKES
jgi:tetraacyldisaccharide 4'-kinase